MTKQEYYDALVTKNIQVAPIDKWAKIVDPVRVAMDRIRYDVYYYDNDVRVFRIDVENDGEAGENIVGMTYDPTAVVQEPEATFTERVEAKIEDEKGKGTILAGFVKENNNVNSALVLAIMADKTEQNVLIRGEADESLSITLL
jgi:hypothetical protein